MAILKKRLKASSILEVVVAMVLISMITSISLLIYVNTITSLKSSYQLGLERKAQYYLDTYEQLPEERQVGFIDDDLSEIQFFKTGTELKDLYELTATVTDSSRLHHASKTKLIYQYEEVE